MFGYVVINKVNGRYLARRGSKSPFTNKLEYARVFSTKEKADAERCVDSEYSMSVDALLPTPE